MLATLLSSAGTTKRLDRLAEARPPHAAGEATIDRAVETHVANEEHLLRGLTAAERRSLDELLRNS